MGHIMRFKSYSRQSLEWLSGKALDLLPQWLREVFSMNLLYWLLALREVDRTAQQVGAVRLMVATILSVGVLWLLFMLIWTVFLWRW